ncbi:MAG: ATP-dependent DNA helicase RecG [Slackia sp.]|nr:ATP-dependent DNA helicase RecG [Slackia sp.]
MIDRLAAALRPESPVTDVAGVSSARAAALSRLGVRSVRDLLTHYPHRYIDMSSVQSIASAPIGRPATVVARVHEVTIKRPKPHFELAEVTLVDGTGTLVATFFRQSWLAKTLPAGTRVSVAGDVEFNYGFKRMTMPFLDKLDDDAPVAGKVVPVHRATEGLPAGQVRTLIGNALASCAGMHDPLPHELRMRYRLMSRSCALRAIHFPRSAAERRQARRRLAYEEVLLLELHMMRRQAKADAAAPAFAHVSGGPCFDRLFASLPFELTSDQMLAIEEVRADMASPRRMNRMLLGDVGTGKTMVAAFALTLASDSGTQALMMAPTDVLARQYAAQIGPMLDAAGVTWTLVTGSASASERAEAAAALGSGAASVAFGTHALLENDVACRACTLVIVDEEQRFGVDQRDRLIAKGVNPDFLSMTATPIPRTLALALYGSLSLSYLRETPGNRGKRSTSVVGFRERGRAYDAALAACERGEQVYVVCPLVGEKPASDDASSRKRRSSHSDADEEQPVVCIESDADMRGDNLKAAEAEAAFLQAKTFSAYTVGLLHGRMKGDEKRAVMERFRSGEIDVLVSTTVIEVGVDVGNATVMIVEDAERFGLSQLHQLRGRVGRSEKPGEVYLVAATSDEHAVERLKAMERIDDGFELAEFDLSLRREGDILGNRQHGASSLKLVNVTRDAALIEAAHADAQRVIAADPEGEHAETRLLYREADVAFARM